MTADTNSERKSKTGQKIATMYFFVVSYVGERQSWPAQSVNNERNKKAQG